MPDDRLQPFGGYPYLVTRIGLTALRHLALLPRDWDRTRLLDLARRQAAANRLPTALCIGPADIVYFDEELQEHTSEWPPSGVPLLGRLAIADDLPESQELQARRVWLEAWAKERRGTGYLVGDGLEAGRLLTAADRRRLNESDSSVAPFALQPCDTCGWRRGEYLAIHWEGNGDTRPRVVHVHCECDNWNRCARCLEPLASSRLSAYRWDDEGGEIRYLAAYAGLSHTCVI